MLNFDKYDRYGEVIRPGDVCARAGRGGAELVVYKGHSWGAKGSKGEFEIGRASCRERVWNADG